MTWGIRLQRDGKSGKQQIVLGLSAMIKECQLSIEVFPGNPQIPRHLPAKSTRSERFGGGEVTFVGDRGMNKGPQIQLLKEHEATSTTFLSQAAD